MIKRRKLAIGLAFILMLLLVACGGSAAEEPAAEESANEAPATAVPVEESAAEETNQQSEGNEEVGELQVTITEEGDGPQAEPGQLVAVHYTGMLDDGTVFDSSVERGQPIEFVLGSGRVIPGWEEGIAQMRVGDKATLVIPPHMAYGPGGRGSIPPNATLTFDVELIAATELPKAPEAPTEVADGDYESTDSGLKYFDIVEGDGDLPTAGQTVIVHYTGWLEDGTMFDSSIPRNQPAEFAIGVGQVIPGWDEGLLSMPIGTTRQLVIPADLGYGAAGAGGVIPPNATLIFEVELVGVR
ncbi:MAG: FKBP-type peptidyl-prolyl cis-trans isomerase [Chloroflexota bacterium]